MFCIWVTSSVLSKVFKSYWSLISTEYQLWCSTKLKFWTGASLSENVDILMNIVKICKQSSGNGAVSGISNLNSFPSRKTWVFVLSNCARTNSNKLEFWTDVSLFRNVDILMNIFKLFGILWKIELTHEFQVWIAPAAEKKIEGAVAKLPALRVLGGN